MRVRFKVSSGNAVCWNGRNVDEVKAIAGDHFIGLHSSYVIVDHSSGDVVWVREGWWVVRLDGSDDVRVSSAGAFAEAMEIEPEHATSE